ncbi:hypothetical protein B0A49_12804, partial [Cryomyces minteri]
MPPDERPPVVGRVPTAHQEHAATIRDEAQNLLEFLEKHKNKSLPNHYSLKFIASVLKFFQSDVTNPDHSELLNAIQVATATQQAMQQDLSIVKSRIDNIASQRMSDAPSSTKSPRSWAQVVAA